MTEFFQEWRAADRQAFAAEQELMRNTLQAITEGDCEPPDAQRQEAAKRLRRQADDLFRVAMAEMALLAAQLRR